MNGLLTVEEIKITLPHPKGGQHKSYKSLVVSSKYESRPKNKVKARKTPNKERLRNVGKKQGM